MTEEQWKVYEKKPKFEVSSLGRIRVNTHGNIRISAEIKRIGRYFEVQETGLLGSDPTQHCKDLKLHYIVARTWIPNPDNHTHVRFRSKNTHDCRAANLEWYTPTRKGGRPKKQTIITTDSSWEETLDRTPFPDDPGSVHTIETNIINKTFVIYPITGTTKWVLCNTITNQASIHDSREEAEQAADP